MSSTSCRSIRSAGSHRKGPNNTLDAGPGEPGSPYAIGSAEGGHKAMHPELGTLADFRRFVRACRAQGNGGGAGLRHPVLARPPVGQGAPGVVLHPPGRHHQVRREPAEEVPGHHPLNFYGAHREELWHELAT